MPLHCRRARYFRYSLECACVCESSFCTQKKWKRSSRALSHSQKGRSHTLKNIIPNSWGGFGTSLCKSTLAYICLLHLFFAVFIYLCTLSLWHFTESASAACALGSYFLLVEKKCKIRHAIRAPAVNKIGRGSRGATALMSKLSSRTHGDGGRS